MCSSNHNMGQPDPKQKAIEALGVTTTEPITTASIGIGINGMIGRIKRIVTMPKNIIRTTGIFPKPMNESSSNIGTGAISILMSTDR